MSRRPSIPAGNRGFLDKTVVPSAVPLKFGKSLIERAAAALMFGTPRELAIDEISGTDGIIDEFVACAKQSFEAGFEGVDHELHDARVLSQRLVFSMFMFFFSSLAHFLSPKSNLRSDEFGCTARKRAEVVDVRIIHAVREQTSKELCIGVRLNRVDASCNESLADTMEQIRCIVEAGIDFIERSPGAPMRILLFNPLSRELLPRIRPKSVREQLPSVLLMVTGGFRPRIGMEEALRSGGCDLVGIARPVALLPKLLREIILNMDIPDEEANVTLAPLYAAPFLVRHSPVKQVGAGFQNAYYALQIQRLAKGQIPLDDRT
ncbi:hypothetical protein DSL72_001589 [Monilinia vaccinii-corymbosi]|uniref:NADH:flavin oxidoreductase/NADH oxidase N-terminal domain-containing protein n=1 Tax=Monilinia vaccinii-corymbosi TaxID=61207 RepID=A0A8A3P552_9HELO|nr:hypothetical protein DSL72_001589 [Monilinia vaccinii-corymbosi]